MPLDHRNAKKDIHDTRPALAKTQQLI